MPRYVVLSYSTETEQAFVDVILADHPDAACEEVKRVRDSQLDTYDGPMTPEEFLKIAADIVAETEEETAERWREVKQDYGIPVCRMCSEEYDEAGDGYDGLCPTCADATNTEDDEDDHEHDPGDDPRDWDAAQQAIARENPR